MVRYQTEFDKWAIIHDHTVSLDAFIEWVNNNYLKNNMGKMKIISIGITPTGEQGEQPFNKSTCHSW